MGSRAITKQLQRRLQTRATWDAALTKVTEGVTVLTRILANKVSRRVKTNSVTKLTGTSLDPRQARIVELRFFGGLSLEEAAEVMGAFVGSCAAISVCRARGSIGN